jgi:hypothetical protein
MSSLQISIHPTAKQHLAWQKYHDQTTNEILVGGGAGGVRAGLFARLLPPRLCVTLAPASY